MNNNMIQLYSGKCVGSHRYLSHIRPYLKDSDFIRIQLTFDIFCMTCLLFGNSCIHFILPVKNIAANPLFCTELSDRNSMRNEFPSDVITGGSLDPQKTPCLRISPDPIFEDKAKLSYSQSC